MNAPLRSIAGPPLTPPRGRWSRFVDERLPYLVILLLVLTLLSIFAFPFVTVTVPSGEVGVLWRRFGGGTVIGRRTVRDEGMHLILPWNKLFLYDLRLQSITEDYAVISSDGVRMTASVNIRFRLQRDGVAILHQTLGPDYINIAIRPGVGSLTREVVSQYTAEEVYSTARQEIQTKIRDLWQEKASQKTMIREGEEAYQVPLGNLFILYDTLLYGMVLPPAVVTAINRKAEQYYIVQEYGFRVERERKESERKRIEAQGIRQFQEIVTQGVTPSYLRWRGIDATLQLAQSGNSKVVVLGSGKDSLPVILGGTASSAAGEEGAPDRAASRPPWPSLSSADIAEHLAHTRQISTPPVLEVGPIPP
jgi:regulator of protease activity HflC (stomatin/prohibitin superfamily)